MKHTKRLGALALALVMSLSALSGCGGNGGSGSGASSGSSASSGASSSGDSSQIQPMDLSQVTDPYLAAAGLAGDAVVAQMGGTDITASELLYWLYRNTKSYLDQFGGQVTTLPWDTDMGDGVTFGEAFKQGALDAAVYYRAINLMGGAEGLTPNSSVAASVDQEYGDMVAQLGSEEAVDHVLWAQMLSRELLIYLNQCSDLFTQLQELYFGENSGNYPTDAEVQAYLDEVGTFRVKHILLMTVDQATNEPLDEETIAQKKAAAGDLLAQLQAAEDPIALFDTLMNEHSEDGGLATNPDGYVFNQDDSLVGGFREAALELEVGQISGIVETDYGYHIMLRLPIDPAGYRAEMVGQRMEEKIDSQIELYGTKTLEAYDQIDTGDFWEKLLSLQAAVQAASGQG